MSDSLGLIAAALAKAQQFMENPKFDTQNPFFKNRYASLAAVRDAIVPALAREGICLTQDLQTSQGFVSCVTTLTHASGQQMVFGPYALPVQKQDAQGYGSASTYARRYHLMAVAGVVGDADDDAEASVGRGNGKEKAAGSPHEPPPADSDGVPLGPDFIQEGKYRSRKWEEASTKFLQDTIKKERGSLEHRVLCQKELDKRKAAMDGPMLSGEEGLDDETVPF